MAAVMSITEVFAYNQVDQIVLNKYVQVFIYPLYINRDVLKKENQFWSFKALNLDYL